MDDRDFAGEPRLDPTRLSRGGVVSVFLQENSDAVAARTGTPLRVLEYATLGNKLVWAGDDRARWTVGGGTDWDNDGDARGDNGFAAGDRLIFDDTAMSFAVAISAPVAPATMVFRNSAAQGYEFTGAGIQGRGGLTVAGGGTAGFANAANSFAGGVRVTSGTLTLAKDTSLAADELAIEPTGRLGIDLPAGGNPERARVAVAGGASLAGTL